MSTMAGAAQEPMQRVVDALDRIYSVIIALAISRAVESVFLNQVGQFRLDTSTVSAWPPLFAFLATVIPFYHGMTRHLDVAYVEQPDAKVKGAILLDFIFFFVEAAVLFAFAGSLRQGVEAFEWLGALLVIDIAWSTIAYFIHRGSAGGKAWAFTNATAVIVGIFVYALADPSWKPWLLLTVALVRTVIDYMASWELYFP